MKNQIQKENQLNCSKLSKSDKNLANSNPQFSIKHAHSHLGVVNTTIASTQGQLEAHMVRIEECRALIAQLSDKSNNSNEELLQSVKVHFEKIYNNFTVQITVQRQENEKMQQKIDKIKKEKTEIQQTIIAGAKHCAQLEQELGKYPL